MVLAGLFSSSVWGTERPGRALRLFPSRVAPPRSGRRMLLPPWMVAPAFPQTRVGSSPVTHDHPSLSRHLREKKSRTGIIAAGRVLHLFQVQRVCFAQGGQHVREWLAGHTLAQRPARPAAGRVGRGPRCRGGAPMCKGARHPLRAAPRPAFALLASPARGSRAGCRRCECAPGTCLSVDAHSNYAAARRGFQFAALRAALSDFHDGRLCRTRIWRQVASQCSPPPRPLPSMMGRARAPIHSADSPLSLVHAHSARVRDCHGPRFARAACIILPLPPRAS